METKAQLASCLIQHFQMKELPDEGGLFAETYRSPEVLPHRALPDRYSEDRACGTAILYLLQASSFSALHRLLTDETYHFYLGDPLEMLLLFPDGSSQHVILGQDVLHGQQVQFTVPHGVWQGSSLVPGGQYALIGTTMCPGWEQQDFELGDRKHLIEKYPGEEDGIRKLTRR